MGIGLVIGAIVGGAIWRGSLWAQPSNQQGNNLLTAAHNQLAVAEKVVEEYVAKIRLRQDAKSASLSTEESQRLRQLVNAAFQARHEVQQLQLEQLRERLTHFEREVSSRLSRREQIVSRRIEQLLAKNGDENVASDARVPQQTRPLAPAPRLDAPKQGVPQTAERRLNQEAKGEDGSERGDKQILIHPSHATAMAVSLAELQMVLKGTLATPEQLEESRAKYAAVQAELKAILAILTAEMERKQAELEFYQSEYERARMLFDRAAASKSEVERALILVNQARASLSQSRTLFNLFERVENESRKTSKKPTDAPDDAQASPQPPTPSSPPLPTDESASGQIR